MFDVANFEGYNSTWLFFFQKCFFFFCFYFREFCNIVQDSVRKNAALAGNRELFRKDGVSECWIF